MEHHLYALEVKINKENLIIVSVKCDKITSLEKLRKSLREGDFKSESDISFGLIQQKDEKNYRFVCYEYEKDFLIQIGDANIYFEKESLKNSVQASSLDSIENNIIGDGLADLLLTNIYINSEQMEFEHPSKVRSFFNKRSKGILSRRNKYVDRETIANDYDKTRIFTLHEALSLKAWALDEKTVLIIPFPRYEIREKEFTFPLREIVDILRRKWSKYLNQNSQSIQETLEKEIKGLTNLLEITGFVEEISEANLDVRFENLNLSKIVLNNKENSLIEISSEIETEDSFRKALKEIELPKEEIMVVKNSTFNNQMKETIQSFFHDFAKITKCRIRFYNHGIIEYIDQFNREKTSSKPLLFLVHDELYGSNGLYKRIKTNLNPIPHKVLRYKTIEEYNKNLSNDIIFHNYLPLIHRTSGFIPWYTSNKKFNFVLGCVESSRMGGSVSVCATTIFHENSLRTHSIHEYRYEKHSGNMIEQIVNILERKNIKKEDTILVLIKEMILSKPKITGQLLKEKIGLSNSVVVAYIDGKAQGRIIKEDSIDSNPQRGTYCSIGKKGYLENYLLITTGYPDISDDKNIGFTRPILLQICKEDLEQTPNITSKNIVQMVLDLSYMHPTSFSQSRLPIPIHATNKILEFQPTFNEELLEGILGVL